MLNRQFRLSRRVFLRGVGVSISLPWLESVPVWGAEPEQPAPKRFAAMFMANGVHQKNWWAKGEGSEMQTPLARVVVGGLLTSTLVTLLLVPCLYLLVERGRQRGAASRGQVQSLRPPHAAE